MTLHSLIAAIALFFAIGSPMPDRKPDEKKVQPEYYYGFLTSCGTSREIVFDHPLSLEEQLYWSDYFEAVDC